MSEILEDFAIEGEPQSAREYRRLLLALDQVLPGKLYFIELDPPEQRQRLPARLNADGLSRRWYYLHTGISGSDSSLMQLISNCIGEEPSCELIFVDGLEHRFLATPQPGDDLETLNLAREHLSSLAAAIVFLVPASVVSAFRSHASNFWSWRLYHFNLSLRIRSGSDLDQDTSEYRQVAKPEWDLLVSYSASDQATATALKEKLAASGLRVRLSSSPELLDDGRVIASLSYGLTRSRLVLLLVSESFFASRWTLAEQDAWDVAARSVAGDRVVLGRAESIPEDSLPVQLRHKNPLDLRDHSELEIAAGVLGGRDVVEEMRLFLRPTEQGIEAWWETPEGQGRPFVFTSPISSDQAQTHCWYLEDFPRFPGVGDIVRARAFEKSLASWGEQLFDAITAGDGGKWLMDMVDQRRPGLLTLVSAHPGPLTLPWELLRDPRAACPRRDPRAACPRRDPRSALISRGLVIRRQLPGGARHIGPRLGLPLRILMVVARPTDVGFIDPRSGTVPILDALEPLAGNVTVEFCDPPTLAELSRRLDQARVRGEAYHIVHFDGHGPYLPRIGVGALCFENARASMDLVPGRKLGDLLEPMDIPLVLLEASQTADLSPDPVFESVAPALLKSGVGSVIAFSHPVLKKTGRVLVEQLYAGLFDGHTVGEALNRGRLALAANAERHVRPGCEPLSLHDWHIPQLYQAGPDPVLVPGGASRWAGKPLRAGARPAPEFGRQPAYGFYGRARELLGLGRKLLAHPALALTGMGGMGKTSLAREAAHWWIRTGRRRDGAAFFSFESRQGADRAVQSFGHYLEGDSFDRLGSEDRWQRAVELFHEREVLWVWDNFECTLPAFQTGRGTGTAFRDAERQQLVKLYCELTEGRPQGWLLVTCRPTATGLPGIVEMELSNLLPAEALEMATVILQRKDVPLGEPGWERGDVEKLLAALGHHPLSLELVLPHLKKLPLAAVVRDFGELLDRFTDANAEEGRNRGLLASLAFSTRRLGDEAQQVLPWLGRFDRGAFEGNIIELSELEPERWSAVREELLVTALVEVDDAIQVADRPYLRFHPTLAHAAAEAGADQEPTHDRFVTIYLRFAGTVDGALRGQTPARGMAMMEREEGNMRRAVELAFAGRDYHRGWQIANTIRSYLESAGRVRDQARWAAWVRGEMERTAGFEQQLDEASLDAVRQASVLLQGSSRKPL